MEQWLQTIDTKQAAAVAALGAEVRIQGTIQERTSSVTVRFLLALHSADRRYNIAKILKDLRHGILQQRVPRHPFLTFLRAYQNRSSIIDLIKTGARYHLIPVPGAEGIHQLIPGTAGLPGIAAGTPVVRTTDLKLVTALITAGFRPLEIRQASTGEAEIIIEAIRPAAAGSSLDAATLTSEWRRDNQALPWELPFTQAMHGLAIFHRLNEEVKRTTHTILLTKNSQTHAAIRQDASPAAWDKAKQFFAGR